MHHVGDLGFETRSTCPACRSPEAQVRFTSRFDQPPIASFILDYYKIDPSILDGEYRALQCTRCDTYYQAEVGNAALLEQLYSQWVIQIGDPMRDAHYAFDITHPAKSRDGHEIMTAAAWLGSRIADLRTLDFGMGWASWARVAQSLGCDSYGHELTEDRVAFAAAHGIKPFDPLLTYDFINTEQVFEHLTDPLGTAQMLAAVLSPGGILKISVPSPHGLDRQLDRLRPGQSKVSYEEILPLQPLEHVNCFSVKGLRALARQSGLKFTRPPIFRSYRTLLRRGALDARLPKPAVKELARPIYRRLNPRNHHVWLLKPSA